MLIHTWNEHPDIHANKLNANHLHVQHSTNATTQGNCIEDKNPTKGIRVKVLKENA